MCEQWSGSMESQNREDRMWVGDGEVEEGKDEWGRGTRGLGTVWMAGMDWG